MIFSNILLSFFLLSVYDNIVDIYHPTINDYQMVQDYLSSDDRPDLKHLKKTKYYQNMKGFRIIEDTPDEVPTLGTCVINSHEEQRENCIIIYGSLNNSYGKGVLRFVDLVSNSDYGGHLLYRIGGWPNVEEGDLVLAHVPYAFKVCFFREAKRLGYKRVLWLDSSIVPLISLNKVFDMIDDKGYFVVKNSHNVGRYCNEKAAGAFGLSLKETYSIPSCAACIIGIDFTKPIGETIIDRLYAAAVDETGYMSLRNEQNALSIILYQLGITDFVSYNKLVNRQSELKRNPDAYFWVNREYVDR